MPTRVPLRLQPVLEHGERLADEKAAIGPKSSDRLSPSRAPPLPQRKNPRIRARSPLPSRRIESRLSGTAPSPVRDPRPGPVPRPLLSPAPRTALELAGAYRVSTRPPRPSPLRHFPACRKAPQRGAATPCSHRATRIEFSPTATRPPPTCSYRRTPPLEGLDPENDRVRLAVLGHRESPASPALPLAPSTTASIASAPSPSARCQHDHHSRTPTSFREAQLAQNIAPGRRGRERPPARPISAAPRSPEHHDRTIRAAARPPPRVRDRRLSAASWPRCPRLDEREKRLDADKKLRRRSQEGP